MNALANATAMPPAQSLGEKSIVLIGANGADFQDRRLARDARLRLMNLDKALEILGKLTNVRVVMWPHKGIEPQRREKLEGIIGNLRNPDGNPVLGILLDDERHFESHVLKLLGKAGDQATPAEPTEVEAPPPELPTTITPELPPAPAPAPSPSPAPLPVPIPVPVLTKAKLGRKYYEEVSGSAEKLLKVLQENGYPEATIRTARTLLSNTKIALRKKGATEPSVRKPPSSVSLEMAKALQLKIEYAQERLQVLADDLRKIAESISHVA